MRKHGVQQMKRKPATHQSEELAEGPYPGGNNPEDIQKDLRERTRRGAIKERNKSIKEALNTGQLLIKYTLKINLVTKSSGKKGSTSIGNTLVSQPEITEGSGEEEVGVTITPDFVKNHRETLNARLAELERREKLEKLKAQLSYSEGEPEGPAKKPRYDEELWEKILKMFEEQKTTRTLVEENDDHKKNKGGPEDEEDPRRDEEKVEQFIERFITESMQIQGVPEVMKISSFINGVRQPQLCEKLGEDFPKTLTRMKRKPATHQSEELAEGPYPGGNNPEDIQKDLRKRTKRGGYKGEK
ncbi:hypothetical protein E3N88_04085 [Mikania micrantha]|uniref:Uncharacterized protein n=1 Tax=Mikania micrantha TaxID=192012 RepID=A0A5N6PUP2_9ASTR|nr:hypothetical protein E3N88_04085 [Mikania micrantha]